VLGHRPDVDAAYVFGSAATGRTHRESDVDVGVLVSDRIPRASRLNYRLGLMADLGTALERSDVDVTILNEATPLLAHRVLSQGVLAFERSRRTRIRFQTATARRYFDMLPTYEIYIRALKRSAQRGRRG
jgi:predicted nucleotidyltransferase